MHPPRASNRRHILRHAARLVAACALPALATTVRATAQGARRVALAHTHTREHIDLVFAVGETHEAQALGALNHFLRDHYSGDVGTIDPRLFDLLHRLNQEFGRTQPFEIISGYRSPATNAGLRLNRGGGVAKNSLHMQGQALDLRLPGVALTELRDAALSLRAGGVGYYPRDVFVHLDTGRVRSW